MEDNCRQRAWQPVHLGERQASHLCDCAGRRGLSPSLHPEKADRMGLVEIERNGPPGIFSENPILG